MNKTQLKTEKRERRHRRIRSKISGTADMPRLAVFKSNTSLYAQLINDEKGHTLAAVNTATQKGKGSVEKARKAGAELAKIARDQKISKIVFDRGGFIYTGTVKALAEGVREGGLKF